jgi:hypothetical protein
MPYGADPFPTFTPALATITEINRSTRTIIRTEFPHTFLVGESVRILIPKEYGMTQMNNLVVDIVRINPAFPTFIGTDIDSTSFDAFVVPVNPTQSAQVVPVGENALQLTGATRNVLPYT